MHYSELVNLGSIPMELQTPVEKQPEPVKVDTEEMIQKISDGVDKKLEKLMGDLKVQFTTPSKSADFSLTVEEVREVVLYLKKIQSIYFPTIPIKSNLSRSFVWNLPREIYDAFKNADIQEGVPDIANPLFMFYILCVDEPFYAMDKYLAVIQDQIEVNQESITEGAADWDQNRAPTPVPEKKVEEPVQITTEDAVDEDDDDEDEDDVEENPQTNPVVAPQDFNPNRDYRRKQHNKKKKRK